MVAAGVLVGAMVMVGVVWGDLGRGVWVGLFLSED